MDMTHYRLPDGRIVPVDASAAKGEMLIGFTLADGRIVMAVREDDWRFLHQSLIDAMQAGRSDQAYRYAMRVASLATKETSR